MIRIVLNGEAIDRKDIVGDTDVKTTTEIEGEDGASLVKSVSGELTFYGRAWEIVKEHILDHPDRRLREIPIRIYDTCPTFDRLVFTGVVLGSLVSWCEGTCFVKCTCVEKTTTSAAMDCLKSTLIFDNWNGFQQQAHPRMRYCDEIRPEWLHIVVLILGQFAMLTLDILTPVVYVILGIVTVINLLIDAVNLIPGVDIDNIDFDADPDTNSFQEWQNIRDGIQETLIGCGRAHPSPLVRAYIGNVCAKCGIAFQSSILNSPASDYWNMVLWSAPVEKGTRDDDVTYIEKNRPIMSGHQLLERLKVVFNARYGIRTIGGTPTLVFERRDKLQGATVWVDPVALKTEGRLVGELCYTFNEENPAAYLEIGFSEDGMDEPGNEARDFYKKIVEWNQPFNPAQKGSKRKQFEFGMLRNRRDGIGRDVLDTWVVYPGLTGEVDEYGHAMKVSRGMGMWAKLLIWNGDLIEGQVARGYDPGGDGGALFGKPPDELYNYPLTVGEFLVTPNTAYADNAPNLSVYGRFHAIDNPKVVNEQGVNFTFEFEYTEADLVAMDLFASVPLPAPLADGRIERITINHTQRTILVAGKA